ncbi:helix-turn-helix domain-containing protein [Facklamia hominis]|nr:helix-turn-helix transcriptional regulator [Facklamia hominis]
MTQYMVDISKIQQLISEDSRSLYQIAKDADLDYALLHRLVNGKVKKNVWLDTAFKLADVLGVDVNEFRKEE